MTHPQNLADWRRRKRAEFIARRESLPLETRRRADQRITELLVCGFTLLERMTIGFCWPYRGEFDSRFAVRRFRERGARTALPVVVARNQPLEFRLWWPGVPTTPGVFGLPVPLGTGTVVPDALLIPPVGFDARGYRLGYGGGYFDRTLAVCDPQPLKIGVGYECARLDSIYPQSHDISMDFIVTEAGVHHVTPGGLALIEDLTVLARRVEEICTARALPRLTQEAHGDLNLAASSGSENPETARPVEPSREELLTLLNTLLEAERAGAKVIHAYLEDFESDPQAWALLRSVQRDEAENCAVLADLIRHLGGTPSAATGAFLEKALAVKDSRKRLEFLNRGQEWVARRIGAALPKIADPRVKSALQAMYDSHLANIDRCASLL